MDPGPECFPAPADPPRASPSDTRHTTPPVRATPPALLRTTVLTGLAALAAVPAVPPEAIR
ncbi:hypothetical protein SAMN05428944_4239 [Streptomyces sp. 1222.5]|nr:hypothetical protein BX260_3858 [Streptomyces sp. 5112.2]SEC57518.1 hypothetical protein SAMN05428944_4239 [Streptomyces sp. 1222.5]